MKPPLKVQTGKDSGGQLVSTHSLKYYSKFPAKTSANRQGASTNPQEKQKETEGEKTRQGPRERALEGGPQEQLKHGGHAQGNRGAGEPRK